MTENNVTLTDEEKVLQYNETLNKLNVQIENELKKIRDDFPSLDFDGVKKRINAIRFKVLVAALYEENKLIFKDYDTDKLLEIEEDIVVAMLEEKNVFIKYEKDVQFYTCALSLKLGGLVVNDTSAGIVALRILFFLTTGSYVHVAELQESLMGRWREVASEEAVNAADLYYKVLADKVGLDLEAMDREYEQAIKDGVGIDQATGTPAEVLIANNILMAEQISGEDEATKAYVRQVYQDNLEEEDKTVHHQGDKYNIPMPPPTNDH